MHLEERIKQLEKEKEELVQRIEALESSDININRFATVAEVAKMLRCTTNSVYVKIREGEIYATRKTGGIRIPMSQFYEKPKVTRISNKKPKKAENLTLKEKVFG